MIPLILFYKDNKYIYSENYTHVFYNRNDFSEFINEIHEKYFDKMKVIKINYEAGANNLLNEKNIKESLFFDNLIDIFILNDFSLIDEQTLVSLNSHTEFSIKDKFKPLVTIDDYNYNFKNIKHQINTGEFYQINYTIPFKANYFGNPFDAFFVYHKLFAGNYHAFIPLNDKFLISMSPELFLCKENKKLITQPIKGTSKNTKEDIINLLNSEKENAELSMIVDLLRNDLNIVSNFGDKVNFHRKIMNLKNLVHTYSEIEVETEKNISEILLKTLPGGSISGCPKKSAVNYINICEKYQRGFYTGNLGWFYKDDFMLNILIRSFMCVEDDNKIYYHSGGGIVFDSDNIDEYNEILLKAEKIQIKPN